MGNKLLSQNVGKKGSYTIVVSKDYAVPNKPVSESIKDLSKTATAKKACFRKGSKQVGQSNQS